jgi:hypothetical protein
LDDFALRLQHKNSLESRNVEPSNSTRLNNESSISAYLNNHATVGNGKETGTSDVKQNGGCKDYAVPTTADGVSHTPTEPAEQIDTHSGRDGESKSGELMGKTGEPQPALARPTSPTGATTETTNCIIEAKADGPNPPNSVPYVKQSNGKDALQAQYSLVGEDDPSSFDDSLGQNGQDKVISPEKSSDSSDDCAVLKQKIESAAGCISEEHSGEEYITAPSEQNCSSGSIPNLGQDNSHENDDPMEQDESEGDDAKSARINGQLQQEDRLTDSTPTATPEHAASATMETSPEAKADVGKSSLVVPDQFRNRRPKEWSKASICPHCEIAFVNARLHALHMRYHTFGDPFCCNECGKTCETPEGLFLHLAQEVHMRNRAV